jgi:hypothetical protein
VSVAQQRLPGGRWLLGRWVFAEKFMNKVALALICKHFLAMLLISIANYLITISV